MSFLVITHSFISWTDFKDLTKCGLSLSVVFSSVAGYLLGAEVFSVRVILLVAFGGYCMVGASNVFNQIVERDLDSLMMRTKNRPLPTGRTTPKQAFFIGIFMCVIGLVLLYMVNSKTAMFAAISTFVYTSVYTPLKVKTPLSVFAGAIPGAIPFMLGWVAATNEFGIEALTLFMIQFFWQFPHFWSIGWLLDDEYKKAGFQMLPTLKKDKSTVLQILLYTVWMMLVAVFPLTRFARKLSISIPSAILLTIAGGIMLFYGVKLYHKKDDFSARRLILAGIFYITFLQIVYVSDKYIRYFI